MKEKLFDLIVLIRKSSPNDSEFGNLVRKLLLVTDDGKVDMETADILEKINANNKIKI